jgi:hypothetical protein
MSDVFLGMWVVAYRELLRFIQERSRMFSSFAMPLLFLVIFGAGVLTGGLLVNHIKCEQPANPPPPVFDPNSRPPIGDHGGQVFAGRNILKNQKAFRIHRIERLQGSPMEVHQLHQSGDERLV